MMIMRNCWNKMRWMERKDLCVLSCLRSYLLRQSTLVVVTLVVTGCESNLLGAANHLSGSLAGNAQDAQDTKNEQKLAQSQKKSLKMPPSSASKTGKFTPKISDSPLPGVTSSKKTPKVLTDAFIAKGTDYKPRTHHLLASGAPKYINRLILESSPYLLQHAHNPVNWYPWGDEPFARAQAEGKLVFMSIGYSTCHWCHVMERESFENDDIARFLNENFICIKVDREERPDVDSIYMSAVTMLTGRGGWPMTTVLLPRSREPIFGGTYFPPKGNRYGRPSLTSVLQNLLTEYKSDPNTLQARGAEISAKMQAMAEPRPQVGMPDEGALISLAEQQKSSFDPKWGGFGRAPKFPRPSVLLFLLRYYRRSNDPKVLEMVTVTLDKMAEGGMHDQLGGGFHRYSTDQRWLVPHFEKMLYDNSQLTIAYIEALQATGKKRFGEVARHTLDYVLAEMTDPTEGTFYSATDADSPVQNGGHDEEGLFFTWTPEELIQALGKQKSAVFADFYGVKSGGNFEGRSILHRLEPASVVASRHHLTEQKLNILITDAKKILYPIRAKRLSPLLDDKVIAGWNGLMISALAKGAMALDNDRYLKAALRAGSFIWDNMVTDDRLSRVWHQGKRGHAAVLDDYGFFIAACLDLYEASQDPIWIKRAKALQTVVDTEFADFNNGGYFMTSNLGEKLLTREKSNYDGAIPAGNSYVLNNLLRLYEYTGDTLYREGAVRGFRVFNGDLRRRGRALPQMLSALDMYLDRPLEIVIVAPDTAGATPFVREVNKRYLPNKTLSILVGEGQSERHGLEIPLVQDKVARGGKPTAYVCRNNVCELPATDISVFRQQLSQVDLLKGALRR